MSGELTDEQKWVARHLRALAIFRAAEWGGAWMFSLVRDGASLDERAEAIEHMHSVTQQVQALPAILILFCVSP